METVKNMQNQPDEGEKHSIHQLEHLSVKMDEIQVRQRAKIQEAIEEHGPRNGWIKKDAVQVFMMDGNECWIVKNPMWEYVDRMAQERPTSLQLAAGYNGYVCFKKKPVIEPGWSGILTYVPVHGGITYAVHDEIGSVYGFDTGHFDSGQHPIRNIEWIRGQIDVMARAILVAASVEQEYLQSDGDNEKRAKLIQQVVSVQPDESLNFLTRLNIITGQL